MALPEEGPQWYRAMPASSSEQAARAWEEQEMAQMLLAEVDPLVQKRHKPMPKKVFRQQIRRNALARVTRAHKQFLRLQMDLSRMEDEMRAEDETG
jgi:hypothetical protein